MAGFGRRYMIPRDFSGPVVDVGQWLMSNPILSPKRHGGVENGRFSASCPVLNTQKLFIMCLLEDLFPVLEENK